MDVSTPREVIPVAGPNMPSHLLAVVRSQEQSLAEGAVKLAVDVILGIADSDAGVRPQPTIIRGATDVGAALDRFGLSTSEISSWAVGDRVIFAEGRTIADGGAMRAFVLEIDIDASEAVRRVVLLHCSDVSLPGPPIEVTGEGSSLVALGVATTYFDTLHSGDLDGAARCFSTDCFYSHPPYTDGDDRVEFLSRDELLEGWVNRRTKSGNRLTFSHVVQSGSRAFLAADAHGSALPDGATCLSTFVLDADGLIHHYVAFKCIPGVPRT